MVLAGTGAFISTANFGYSRAKTVNENLKINVALLSRFDLVFILLDKPDEQLDKQVSEHIMSLHTGSGNSSQTVKKLTELQDVRTEYGMLKECSAAVERAKLLASEVVGLEVKVELG